MKKQPKRRKKTKKPIKAIRVMGQMWDVTPIAAFKDDPNQMGEMVPEERALYIKAGMAETATRDTLIHEIVHAYQEVNHMDLIAIEDEDLQHRLREYFAQYTASLMLDLIVNNPALIRRLLED